jgi:hypothetical protein
MSPSFASTRSGLLALALLLAACDGAITTQTTSGALRAAFTLTDVTHDVTAMRYTVVASGASCSGPAIATKLVAADKKAVPAAVQPPDAGALHPLFDAFFTLPEGAYHLCAIPMAGELASQLCERAEGDATVVAQATTEVLLVSQCRGARRGGLDVITTLNDPPVIDNLDIAPSKFIATCDRATFTATASDPNGDALSFTWEIVSGPAGASLIAVGASATFSTVTAGEYTVRVTARDVYGASASLTFPVHVTGGNCLDKRVFVTSQGFAPSWGGVAGGDAICQGLADAQHLGGTWLAWLSTTKTDPVTRFSRSAARYVRLDGAVVALGFTDLITRDLLLAPINVNELGGVTHADVWTGTTQHGTIASADCGDWTRSTPEQKGEGVTGSSDGFGFNWTVRGLARSCFLLPNTRSLYCFEQ